MEELLGEVLDAVEQPKNPEEKKNHSIEYIIDINHLREIVGLGSIYDSFNETSEKKSNNKRRNDKKDKNEIWKRYGRQMLENLVLCEFAKKVAKEYVRQRDESHARAVALELELELIAEEKFSHEIKKKRKRKRKRKKKSKRDEDIENLKQDYNRVKKKSFMKEIKIKGTNSELKKQLKINETSEIQKNTLFFSLSVTENTKFFKTSVLILKIREKMKNLVLTKFQKINSNLYEYKYGMMFICNSDTYEECFNFHLICFTRQYLKDVSYLKYNSSILFLFNITTRTLHGLFKPCNLEIKNNNHLVDSFCFKNLTYETYISFEICQKFKPLPEKLFRHLFLDENRIRNLDKKEIKNLILIFRRLEG